MRRSEQTVPYNYLVEIIVTLFFTHPFLKGVFKDMSTNLKHGSKFLKLPITEFAYCDFDEFRENVKKSCLLILAFDFR